MREGKPALHKLVEAFNEGNETRRRALLEECWTVDGRLLDDGVLVADNRDGLEALVRTSREDPQFSVRLTASVEESSDRVWSRWQVRRCHGEPESRNLVGRRAVDGPLQELQMTTADASPTTRKLSYRLQEAVAANPIAAVGLLGGALYLALRIPLGLFYGDLGVTPDEVGFGPEVLVPQSLTLLAVFLLVMVVLWLLAHFALPVMHLFDVMTRLQERGEKRRVWTIGAALAVVAVLSFAVAMALPTNFPDYLGIPALLAVGVVIGRMVTAVLKRLPWVAAEFAEVDDSWRRLSPLADRIKRFGVLAAFYGSLLLLVGLPIWALLDADSIRRGGDAGGRMVPWRAVPVELRWGDTKHPAVTNSCRKLRLLGVANGQMIVFDTRLDKAVRIPVADASASVRRDCSKADSALRAG